MGTRRLRAIGCLTAGLVAGWVWGCGGPGPSEDLPELRAGSSYTSISPSRERPQRFRLALREGDFLRVAARQAGADVALSLLDPAGETVLTADRDTWERGEELLLAVAGAAGAYLLEIEVLGVSEGGGYSLEVETLEPATEPRRRLAAAYLDFAAAKALTRGDPELALERFAGLRERFRQLGETALEAEVEDRIGSVLYLSGRSRWGEAREAFRAAAEGFRASGDEMQEGLARHHLGLTLLALGEPAEALDAYERALEIGERSPCWQLVANALHGLAQGHQKRGELQEALDSYERALAAWSPDPDCRGRSNSAHNLAVLYWRDLHRPERALRLLETARECWQRRGDRKKLSITEGQIGRALADAGAPDAAETRFEGALELWRPEDGGCRRALLQARRARLAERRGQAEQVGALAAEAEDRLAAEDGCGVDGVHARRELAAVYEAQGRTAAALAAYEKYLDYAAAVESRLEEARARSGLARILHAQGRLDEALAASRAAVELLQGLRPELEREDFRTSFFAAVQSTFEGYVELLMAAGRSAEALEAAESARARSFHDRLAEIGLAPADLAQGASPASGAEVDLLREAAELRRRLAEESEKSAARAGGGRTADELLDRLLTVEGRLRSRSPRAARALRGGALALAELRRLPSSGETVLFYQLGERRSFLWVLEQGALTAFELPPRREIEPLAAAAADDLRRRDGRGGATPAVCSLSREILGPVARRLAATPGGPLLVVADGALHAVAFAALPLPSETAPCGEAPLLLDEHPVSYVPSLSVLAQLRQVADGRLPAPKPLAAFGDPVYGPADPRCPSPAAPGEPGPPRLPASGEEARAICRLTGGDCFLGFEARRDRLVGGGTASYRALLLAVHGAPDEDQPLLSSLVLSLRDAHGRPVPGRLNAYEIASLDLRADLVVLSACATGRGVLLPGEGLVSGLVRGFFSAGAPRVVATLWQVEDASSRELMVAFFDRLQAGTAPAEALRQAQLRLRRDGRAPYQWATFVLHGDRRPLPPPQPPALPPRR